MNCHPLAGRHAITWLDASAIDRDRAQAQQSLPVRSRPTADAARQKGVQSLSGRVGRDLYLFNAARPAAPTWTQGLAFRHG